MKAGQMPTRHDHLHAEISFHEADVAATRALIGETRRQKAKTAEVFANFRTQFDTFELAILSGFDALEAKINARLESLDGPSPEAVSPGRALGEGEPSNVVAIKAGE
jgi:hypothetical protein